MNKIVQINLGGRSYSIEEPGYIVLNAYLDDAEIKLSSNPDKDEILKDINQAIGEKCDTYLSNSKNVITTSEIETIIKEMGPVEETKEETRNDKGTNDGADKGTGTSADGNTDKSAKEGGHKKLYLISEGAVFMGVCNGLAAYFDMDVTVVRIIFVALAVLTHGAWILIYFIMMLVVPKANTPQEKAEAFGTIRMNARDFMQKARENYEKFQDPDEWKKWKEETKEQAKEEKKRWKYEQKAYRYQYQYKQPSPFYELMQSILGLVWFAFFVYICWIGYNHVPFVKEFFNSIGVLLQQLVDKFQAWVALH